MPGPCRPGIDHAVHVVGEAGHVEGAVLHPDIHVVGPGRGIDAALRLGQHVAAMRAVIIDCLILLQQLDAAIDPLAHGCPPAVFWQCWWKASMLPRHPATGALDFDALRHPRDIRLRRIYARAGSAAQETEHADS